MSPNRNNMPRCVQHLLSGTALNHAITPGSDSKIWRHRVQSNARGPGFQLAAQVFEHHAVVSSGLPFSTPVQNEKGKNMKIVRTDEQR